ncbi:hypothetical protein ABMA28_012167 [Loxostege sticticalis]|uniref:Chitin-binding type-2 domain-containing protein n=1 Tax=Loxostege sticticalis TaxID=481309 RepID=A0ABD0TLV4_LOXSC
MLWVNLLWVLPLLAKNVQAADNYFGNGRNWNLRRPALPMRPNAVVSPIHEIPKPLPEPVEVEHVDAVPEIQEPVTLENKPTENDYDLTTARPNYRLLPRGRLLRTRPEPNAIIITTEPATVEAIQTTPSYTNPPDQPLATEDIEVIRTNPRPYNPPPGRALLPRPRPERIELNRPQPVLPNEITTTAGPLPTIPAVETTSQLYPDAAEVITSPKPEEPLIIVLPDNQPTPIHPTIEFIPPPEEPKIEIALKPEPVEPEIVFEAQPEKVEEPPKPEVIILEQKEPVNDLAEIALETPQPLPPLVPILEENEPVNDLSEIALETPIPLPPLVPILEENEPVNDLDEIAIETPKPLPPLVPYNMRRPQLPYRVPKPVVSTQRPRLVVTQAPLTTLPPKVIESKPLQKSPLPSNPGLPKPVVSTQRPRLVVTQAPLTTLPPKVIESKPLLKSPLPPNPGSQWTTPAPKQLYDYRCKEADGYYGIAGDCDNYVECKKNIAIMYSCPDGLHYNPRARWPEYPCAYPSEVQCEKNSVRQLAHPTDECPQQYGFYAMSDSDCSRYVMCQEGKAFVMTCPVGLVFNAASSSCDWPENVPSCKPDVFRGFTCPAPPLEEDGSPSEFIFKYRYKESCKEYVACQRGHPRLLSCDPGMSFDEESQVCLDSDYVSNCKYY